MDLEDSSGPSADNEDMPEACHHHSNVNVADIDEETNIKLRGDAIGDTMYSQSFVLKTLMQFSDLKWNGEVEEDLCFLWDMTVEKEVCELLFDVNYPSVAADAIGKYVEENRFIEIVIGILANILCADCKKPLSNEEIGTFLRVLDSDDPLILVQVMRFLSAISHVTDDLSFVNEDVMAKMMFILCNSVNTDLLTKSLEAMSKLTRGFRLNQDLINLNLYNAVIIAYQTVTDNLFLDNNDAVAVLKYTLEIISNICTYVGNFENYQLLIDLQRNCDKFILEVIKVMKFFSQEQNMSEDFTYFMSVFRYTLTTLNISYYSQLFTSLCAILCTLLKSNDKNEELLDSVLELICFLLSRSELSHIKKDLKQLTKSDVRSVISTINENQHKYEHSVNVQELSNFLRIV